MINNSEKKYIILVFVLIIIVLIIALVNIWKPLFSNNTTYNQKIAQYTIYDQNEYNSLVEEKQISLVKKYIEINNYDSTFSNIDKDFLKDNNLDESNLYEFLIQNNLLFNVNSSTIIYKESVKTDGERFIYTYLYSDGMHDEKRIHFIEEYLGNYTISFSQEKFPLLHDEVYSGQLNDLSFTVKEVESFKEAINYSITIENKSTNVYEFDVSSLDSVNIEINNYYKYNLNSVVAGTDSSYIEISPGEKRTINLSFNVNVSDQSLLTAIIFNNVKRTDGTTIPFNINFE